MDLDSKSCPMMLAKVGLFTFTGSSIGRNKGNKDADLPILYALSF